MADSLSISPVALFSPAGVSPVAFTLPANGRPAPAISSVVSRDSVVDLSANGQLLSTLFSFRSALEALPVDTADSSPAGLASTVRGLVEAFATLQNNRTILPDLAAADSLFPLQDLGIDLLRATATTPPTVDLTALNSAIAADPVATQTTLAAATQSLIEQAGTLEAAVASTVVPPTIPLPLAPAESAPVGTNGVPPLPVTTPDDSVAIGTTINPLLQPPATTPPPPVAAATPAVNPPPALVPEDAVSAEEQPLPLSPTDVSEVIIANTVPADQANPPATTAGSPPTVPPPAIAAPIPTPTPAIAVPTDTPPPLVTDAIAAERRASANAIALQTLLSDPRLRALDNQADPAYAAVIAASHLSDFDSPRPFTSSRSLASETIGPVSALVRARAIADYREAAGEPEQRTLIGTSTTRQYWV